MKHILLPLLSLLLLSCGASRSGVLPDATMIRSELYFGMSRPDGGVVSDEQWSRFLDTAITPRFPEGLTVLDASGQYRMASGVLVKERTKMLVIVHPPAADSLLTQICRLYAAAFNQESVMKVSGSCSQGFIGR
jgi:hypothetical protein